jgi:hypothetical protein
VSAAQIQALEQLLGRIEAKRTDAPVRPALSVAPSETEAPVLDDELDELDDDAPELLLVEDGEELTLDGDGGELILDGESGSVEVEIPPELTAPAAHDAVTAVPAPEAPAGAEAMPLRAPPRGEVAAVARARTVRGTVAFGELLRRTLALRIRD